MNYPSGVKKSGKTFTANSANFIDYANRGMKLEDDLNVTNQYYLDMDVACIYKKPTPIKITKVNYPSRDKATIEQAFFVTPSTTDYNGVYKGKYVDFEAKETTSLTSFPLNNIHQHQITHLQTVKKHGGIAFIIVRFTILNETYVLFEKELTYFLNHEKRKSIPIDYFRKYGFLLKDKFNPRVDYLEILDKVEVF